MAMDPAAISARPAITTIPELLTVPDKPGRQRERHRQPVGHADDDIADGIAGLKMLFDMRSGWHVFPAIFARIRQNIRSCFFRFPNDPRFATENDTWN